MHREIDHGTNDVVCCVAQRCGSIGVPCVFLGVRKHQWPERWRGGRAQPRSAAGACAGLHQRRAAQHSPDAARGDRRERAGQVSGARGARHLPAPHRGHPAGAAARQSGPEPCAGVSPPLCGALQRAPLQQRWQGETPSLLHGASNSSQALSHKHRILNVLHVPAWVPSARYALPRPTGGLPAGCFRSPPCTSSRTSPFAGSADYFHDSRFLVQILHLPAVQSICTLPV